MPFDAHRRLCPRFLFFGDLALAQPNDPLARKVQGPSWGGPVTFQSFDGTFSPMMSRDGGSKPPIVGSVPWVRPLPPLLVIHTHLRPDGCEDRIGASLGASGLRGCVWCTWRLVQVPL